MHSSSFQHSMHQYDNMGKQIICSVPASIKSVSHMSFLDNHSSCIIGESMENVHKTDGQNMTTIELFTTWKPLTPTHLFSTLEVELNSFK